MNALSRPPHIAIVGTGPAAFYAAADLLQRAPTAHVNLFDRLPTPGGLARYGVSPDHAGRRRVIATYESLVMSTGRLHFHGGVDIGTDISHDELLACHDAVIYACGCAGDQSLGIPGEDLPGSHPASQFVGWYNGHPDHAQHRFNLNTERAVVVGNGNVALDVARMLLLAPERLARTDMAEHALAALRHSQVQEVVVLGRRGPAECAFTTPELLELGHLDEIDVVIDNAPDLLSSPPAGSVPVSDARDYAQHLKLQLLREYAQRAPRSGKKRLVLRFQTSPLALEGEGHVQALRVGRNRLVTDATGKVQAQATGDEEVLETGLVLRSVGYRGSALPGLPFDPAKGTLPNQRGRVMNPAQGQAVPGVYVVGWQKRGPSGVIGSNKCCAQETVTELLQDLPSLQAAQPIEQTTLWQQVLTRLRPGRVDYRGWKAIDRAEQALGLAQGRPRVKFTSVDAMRRAAAET